MSFLSCSVLGAASCPIALTSAHRPLQQRQQFRPFWTLRLALLGGAPCVTVLGISYHPYMRLFCSRRARPADDNGVAIASVLSFSPQAAPSTAVADYTAAVDEPVSHCYAAFPSRVPWASARRPLHHQLQLCAVAFDALAS